ncbi:AfsR/SARP family transcriptional regulator [Nocardia macrotermitis]|uniref:Bacterial transcriptional activator domain-containing protein n=1 Tax=Nocardia macrotermitis TaxID=2585198 RepID=A0A7K0D5B7_9NOCA|nr:BTAD domain-containing putative transcriptional regulator [Nocardia macrotermitis]MQY20946.1 hypothetical protein [Nocardia macrotermitis]
MTDVRTEPAEAGASIPFCRILGPTEVEIDGVPANLGGPRTRQVLTVLSTGLGVPVPDDYLIDRVWRNEQPRNVVQALRTMINRLRTGLGAETGHRYLQRGRGGYALTVPLEQTDYGRLPALITRAQQQLAHGSSAVAVRDFEAAVELWRGAPWEELGDMPELTGARVRLGELYETALEELQAARLVLGETAAAIAALPHAIEAAPYRERRWELLALALYRSGRQTEALAALHRFRQRLRADTGTDPGPSLRTLEQRILHQDPALLAPDSATAIDPRRIPPETRPGDAATGSVRESPSTTVLRVELHPDLVGDTGNLPLPAASGYRKANSDKVIQPTVEHQVDTCIIEDQDAADIVRRSLRTKHYDAVFISTAIQFSADPRLLTTIVNLAHTLQPHCRFVFGEFDGSDPIERTSRPTE